jgi:magnesium transporter
MTIPKKKRSGKAGMPPGSLVHIGEKKEERARITLMDYDQNEVQEREVKDIAECFPFRDTPTVTWINIDGLHDVEVIERLGGHFNLHPLILEDILNTSERPKIEDYGDYLFAVLKVFLGNASGSREERVVQVSIILGRNFVLSFQEKANPIFDAVKERIRRGKGRLRRSGADYLAYALIDSIVDSYFAVLERFGDEIESLEEELVADPKREILQRIHNLKSEMIFLRRSIWPLREVVNTMERWETPLISAATDVFLRDVYDHTIQVIENLESYRDVLSGMVETYLSSVSNRMNEVMKLLTIIATIFIPLTFLAGVYGMNFKFMPELGWRYGYFIVWGVMLIAAVAMIIFFKRKKWL